MDTQTKQALKARAHHLKPIILIGAKGLTKAVLNETNIALNAHELIKVKIMGMERDDKAATADSLCRELDAQCIQKIGNTFVIYRPKPEENT